MSLYTTIKFISRHPLGSVARFVRWQIGTRILREQVAVRWVNDSRLLVRRGDTGLTQNIYCGLAEFESMAFALHILRPKDLFVDVGANAGSYSVLAGSVGAEVVAFEPIPHTFNKLRRNMAINHIAARCMNEGVGADKGAVRFSTGKDAMNHALASGERGESIEVDVNPLDQANLPNLPAFIKIDVEGFEANVIAGAENTLSTSAFALIVEMNECGKRYGFDVADVDRKIVEHGFTQCAYFPFARRLEPSKELCNGNALYVKNLVAAQIRVREAPRFEVFGHRI